MEEFPRKLITEWRRLDLPFEGEKILVAVSGGADSCALALGLADLRDRKKFDNRFIIAHFNHNLRGVESDADAEFTKDLADEFGFEFLLGEQKEEFDDKANLEQSARNARYKFLSEAAADSNSNFVLTAHTQNDQAETLLLNLIRGSGIEGLAGMKVSRRLHIVGSTDSIKTEDLMLVRPLLSWAKREDTEKFVDARGIEIREDSMNHDKRFNRVRIRKELIGELKTYNPKIVGTLARTANTLRNDVDILESVNANNFLPLENLPLKLLKNLGEPGFKRFVRSWLKEKRGDLRNLDQKHVDAIVSLVKNRKSGSVCELPGGEKVIKKKGELIFIGSEVEKRF